LEKFKKKKEKNFFSNRPVCHRYTSKRCITRRTGKGCSRKHCCKTVVYKGREESRKCYNGKEHCSTRTTRRCKTINLKNKFCKRKQCCVEKHRAGKVVSRKCRKGKKICQKRFKKKCKTKTSKNCELNSCLRYRYIYKIKYWKKNFCFIY